MCLVGERRALSKRRIRCYGKVARIVLPLSLGVCLTSGVLSVEGGKGEPRAMPERRIGVRRGQMDQAKFNAG